MFDETRGQVEIKLTEEQAEQIRKATGEEVERVRVEVESDAAREDSDSDLLNSAVV